MAETPRRRSAPSSRRSQVLVRGRTARVAVAATRPVDTLPAPGPEATTDVLHLLRRTTYGPTPALAASLANGRHWAWLRDQLDPASVPDRACDTLLTRWPRLAWTPAKIRDEINAGRLPRMQVLNDLPRATTARRIWSERQLLEVMTEVWSDHFNVTCPSDRIWHVRHTFDQMLRARALGSFSDLLVAATTHPAMLRYLSNDTSTARHPNENLGRELLELHTVGIGGGYTEAEVVDSARILTGLGVSAPGEAVWSAKDRWTGPVRVLGFTAANADPAGGPAVVDAYLRHLAALPATARTVTRRLAVRFVGDDPPQPLLDRLVQTYLTGGTQIVPVLWQIFTSAEFAASRGTKLRRPFEDVAATVRVLGHRPDASGTAGIEALTTICSGLGHAPLRWPTPDGYPDVAPAWTSAAGMLARWNAHLDIAAGWYPKTLVRPPLESLLPSPLPATHGPLVDALAQRLLVGPLTPGQRDAVHAFLGARPTDPVTARSAAITYRLASLVGLLLDSPRHLVR